MFKRLLFVRVLILLKNKLLRIVTKFTSLEITSFFFTLYIHREQKRH